MDKPLDKLMGKMKKKDKLRVSVRGDGVQTIRILNGQQGIL